MSVRDAVELTRGRHEQERDRLERRVQRRVARIVRKLQPELRRHMINAWLQDFGSLDFEPEEEQLEQYALDLRFNIEQVFAPRIREFEDIERWARRKSEKLARRQARERIAALYG